MTDNQRDLNLSSSPISGEDLVAARSGPPPSVKAELSPVVPSVVYDTFWRFAAERQAIFYRKAQRKKRPWTSDPVLSQYRFTNVFRAADRASQFLIQSVIYSGSRNVEDLVFRVLLFRVFNRIQTWQVLKKALGEISWREYSFDSYNNVLSSLREGGEPVYSAAYIMPSPSQYGHERKHSNHLKLVEEMISQGVPSVVSNASTMEAVYNELRSFRSIGRFLAYQFSVDLNYTPIAEFGENDFVVPGPGAEAGIKKCFSERGGLSDAQLIELMVDRQEKEFDRLGVEFSGLWGRPLSLVDCQNLFCEVDKYARLAHPQVNGGNGRSRIKQKYRDMRPTFRYWFPPKWELNESIDRWYREREVEAEPLRG